MRRPRALTAAVIAAVFAGLAVPGLALVSSGPAAGADAGAFAAYGAAASGTGVHVLGASNAFQNFSTGAVDNSYPLASTHLDASPAAQATASVADTGPLGATAAGQAMGAQQPQYATATFPGKGTSSVTQGPAVAESKASETSADARAAVVAVGAAGAGSVEQPNDPGHTASDEGESHLTADRAKGVITATSRGHVERAIFGGGALVVAAVDVTATASSDGAKGTPSYQLEVGQVSVNGTPVEVTDKGVVAQKAPVAGSDAAFKAVNEQLNQALTNAGLKVFLAAPQVKVDGATATVSVTGVHVLFNQPPTLGPSVPTQSVEYVLGEAYAFAFGVPATPETPVVTPPEGGGEIATPPAVEGTELGSSVGSVSTPSVATPSTPTATPRAGRQPGTRLAALPVVSRRERPTWLVVVYVIWQALVLATGASLLWWRRLQQAAEAGG